MSGPENRLISGDFAALYRLLDTLCPMHLVLDGAEHIRHAGPTMRKLRPNRSLEGTPFADAFYIKRPRGSASLRHLGATGARTLQLVFADEPRTEMKGLLLPLGADEMVIDLSFGIAVHDAVQRYELTSGDFAATDMAVEMLYLIEAKSAAMEASRRLNLRLQGAKIAAEEQAYTDTLTGLKNRRAVNHLLDRLSETGTAHAVLQVDLDFFKAVNDTLGHPAGDHVLQHVARIMVEETREGDIVARVGGDEFVLILPGVEADDIPRAIARRLIARLDAPIPYGAELCHVSASVGIARVVDGGSRSREGLLSDADVALYAAKRAGRRREALYHPELRQREAGSTMP